MPIITVLVQQKTRKGFFVCDFRTIEDVYVLVRFWFAMDHQNGTPAKSNRKKDPIGKLFALMFFMLITFQLVKRALACLPTFQLVVVVASLNLFLRGEI